MNLLLWSGELSDDLLPVLERLKAIGFDGVEVPIFNLDLDYAAWGLRLKELGLKSTAVTVRNLEDNPISPDASVRQKGIELNRQTLDCCAALGAETLVGPFHSAIGQFTGVGRTRDEWNWGVESMRAVAEHAGSVGIHLGVEAINRFECYFLNAHRDSARFVREVNHPHCGAMYDSFHANIEEKDIGSTLHEIKDVLYHVHISENDRSTPGEGGVDWDATFSGLSQIQYDGWLVIEAFGLALPELAAATKIWRRMFETEFELAENGLQFMRQQVSQYF